MKKTLTTSLLILSNIIFAQVGIGTTSPNVSAALDIKSTTQGFLMPRMTELERNAIVAPAAGLFIYNLDLNCFQFYNGTTWSKCLGEVPTNKLVCSSAISNGFSTVGNPILATNSLTISVIVNAIDTYTFTTNVVNGYSFAASGIFPTLGLNIITLVGTGTPLAVGTDAFVINYAEKALTCNVNNKVVLLPTRNCLDYKNAGNNIDGIYLIDPDGAGGSPPFNCYCDMTNNGGGWTLVFNHNSTDGGLFANDAEADQTNINTPGLTTNKYSILYLIDALRSVPSKYEFRLFYPELSKTNHWSQTFNPRSGLSPTNPVSGYIPIAISMTANGWGGLENNSTDTYLDGTAANTNWYYSIGSQNSWPSAFPIQVPAENSPVSKVQLYIR